MQMQQLRYFLEIAKEKNISAAAKNLYLSQPSLSQQIRKLEEELEVPLLIRHSKSVFPDRCRRTVCPPCPKNPRRSRPAL